MRIDTFRIQTVLLLLASFSAANACAAAINGVVVDDSTARPIPGAFVVAEWTYSGADLVGSRSGCARLEIARADEQGRFSLIGNGRMSWGLTSHVHPYKSGYEWFWKEGKRNPGVVSMRPFKGSAKERSESFTIFASVRSCAKEIGTLEKLRPLYVEIDREIDQLFPDEAAKRYTFIQMLDDGIKVRKAEAARKGV
jgi:hypothetical protein